MLSGFDDRECRMNMGKTLFAQVMEFVPWKTFGRIIERHKGDAGVRTFRRLARKKYGLDSLSAKARVRRYNGSSVRHTPR